MSALLTDLNPSYDLVVIGGGSTGAAVLREATRAGLSALLVERRDFASGTSSRSTKLAQGGLRYLATGDLKLVRQSLKERNRLSEEAPGLAKSVPFTVLVGERGTKGLGLRVGVKAYALLGGRRPQREMARKELDSVIPGLDPRAEMVGGPYEEAPIDDARLVLRLMQDAVERGARAVNYVSVTGVLRHGGAVQGVKLRDERDGAEREITARAVVNATGAWAGLATAAPKLRPIRGSHLVIPASRFPLDRGVSFRHPRDRRFVCAVPWEDVIIVGTTEHDHTESLDSPAISREETAYLLEALDHCFPMLGLTRDDVVSTFAGVRPIVDTETANANDASREHHVFAEPGLVTITGGKLTTCRAMARDALKALKSSLPEIERLGEDDPFLEAKPCPMPLPAAIRARLEGRYGDRAQAVAKGASAAELSTIPGTSTTWAELRFGAGHELVEHLDDLLLRRVRVGLFLRDGGVEIFPRVQAICAEELGWDEARWAVEEARYCEMWRREHGVPVLESRVKSSTSVETRLRMVDADGPVHLAEFGSRGPLVVLLHGVGGAWQNWLPAAPMLAADARVVAVDLVGFGRTPQAGRSHGVEGQLAMLEALLAKFAEPAILVGNSLGGLLGAALAARRPELVAGLVMVSPAQPVRSLKHVDAEMALRGAVHVVPGLGEQAMARDVRVGGARKLFLDLLTLGCVDVSRVPAEVVDANVAIVAERLKTLPDSYATSYFESTRSLVQTLALPGEFEAWVDAVKAPTLLVHGSGDRLVSIEASRRLAARRADWRFVELAGLGHVPQMEDAATFVSHVRSWLAQFAETPVFSASA